LLAAGGGKPGEVLTFEGTLQVVCHPRAVGAAGTVFPGFTESRLSRAVMVAEK